MDIEKLIDFLEYIKSSKCLIIAGCKINIKDGSNYVGDDHDILFKQAADAGFNIIGINHLGYHQEIIFEIQ